LRIIGKGFARKISRVEGGKFRIFDKQFKLMSVLHYTIGLPPVRNGGSVQYAYGLMTEQARTEKVFALVCGDTLFRGLTCRIKYNGIRNGIETFKLTNPLTPTLIYGTSNPKAQYRNVRIDFNNIRNFIIRNEIKIFHLHTLMGIHKDVVAFIKSLGVTIVYTSHDFHGICLHYNLIDYGGELCGNVSAERCAICNAYEPSDRFLRVANSSFYHFIKKSGILSVLNKAKPAISNKSDDKKDVVVSEDRIVEYSELIDYYKDYFKLIDKFHFNSSQTRDVFRRFIPDVTGKVIPVITNGISDKRKPLKLGDNIRFGFIGSLNDYKGFPMLKKVAKELYSEGYEKFRIYVYPGNIEGIDSDCPAIEYKPPYRYSEISDVLYGLDCVIVPSKWYETFSLVALEALAHGRPVIVSDHVGAKDIVATYNKDMIFSTAARLKELIRKILDNRKVLEYENEKILISSWRFSIENHAKEVISYYYE